MTDKETAPANEGHSASLGNGGHSSNTAAQVQPTTNGGAAPNPFDPAALVLGPEATFGSVGVKKLLTAVPVRKPNKQDYVRVNPDPAFRLSPAALIEVRDDRGEFYLLSPAMAAALPGEYVVATIYTAINRQGVLQLWPVKLPGPDGKTHEAHRSAANAAELAMSRWIRIKWNRSLGAYETFVASEDLSDPVWPKDLPFTEILKIAFRDQYVDSPEHPLVQRLRGQI
jgi:hypothetical protein